MRPVRVRYLPAAVADLDNIRIFLTERNPLAARRVLGAIRAAIEHPGSNPGLGHRGTVEGTYEWVVRRTPYIVVYELDTVAREMLVTALMHGARARPPE